MISIVILLIYQEQLINLPFFHKGMSAILCIFFFFLESPFYVFGFNQYYIKITC